MEVGKTFVPCHANEFNSVLSIFFSVCRVWHILGNFFGLYTRPQDSPTYSLSKSGDPVKRARAIVQAVSPEPILVSLLIRPLKHFLGHPFQ
jgi:hypothetical protein